MAHQKRQVGDSSSMRNNDQALQNYQIQCMLLEHQNEDRRVMANQNSIFAANDDRTIRGYQAQWMLLEQQDNERRMMAGQVHHFSGNNPTAYSTSPLQDYNMQLALLEKQNKKRRMNGQDQHVTGSRASGVNNYAIQDQLANLVLEQQNGEGLIQGQSQNVISNGAQSAKDHEQQNRKRRTMADYEPSDSASNSTQNGNHALQDYQMQWMLLEQQTRRAFMITSQERNPISSDALCNSGDNSLGRSRKPSSSESSDSQPQLTPPGSPDA